MSGWAVAEHETTFGPSTTSVANRFAFPFSNVILILLGSQLAARRRRSGLAVSFAVAIGIAFLYYGTIRIGEALGMNDTIPPLPAAWLGNAVFGAVAAFTVARSRG